MVVEIKPEFQERIPEKSFSPFWSFFWNPVQKRETLLPASVYKQLKSKLETQKDSFQALLDIGKQPTEAEKMTKLTQWCRSFTDTQNAAGSNLDTLFSLMTHKSGACRHRSWIFELMARYWGVSARQVFNGIHTFVEYSLDGMKSWHQADLGGSSNYRLQENEFHDYELELVIDTRRVDFSAQKKTTPVHPTSNALQKRFSTASIIETSAKRRSIDKEKDTNSWLNDSLPDNEKLAPEPSLSSDTQNIFSLMKTLENPDTTTSAAAIKQLESFIKNTPPRAEDAGLVIQRLLHFIYSDHYHALLLQDRQAFSLFDRVLQWAGSFGMNKDSILCDFIQSLCQKDRLLSPELANKVTEYLKKTSNEDAAFRVSVLEHLETILPDKQGRTQLARLYEHSLAIPRTLPDLPGSDRQSAIPTASLNDSRTLQGLLARSVSDSGWQWEPNGSMPDIERMVLGEKCYANPVTKIDQKPAIVHIDSQLYDKLHRIFASHTVAFSQEDNLTEKAMSGDSDSTISYCSRINPALNSFDKVLDDFIAALKEQQGINTWYWVLSRGTIVRNDNNGSLEPGCYTAPPCAAQLKSLRDSHPKATPLHLNASRIKRALKLSAAGVLQSAELSDIFRDYLSKTGA